MKTKQKIGIFLLFIIFALGFWGIFIGNLYKDHQHYSVTTNGPVSEKFIKWVDFNIPYEILDQAFVYDVKSYGEEVKLNFVELLAFTAAKNGGNFSAKRSTAMDELVEKLKNGESVEVLTQNMKHYPYYYEAYDAVLGGFIGEYEEAGEKKYGLKVFSPIAKNYGFGHYDDFGNERSYGYARKHEGNDLLGAIGTPIIAVEEGTIEALGWNQYGGWRIGIRSNDQKRYYYYAHLRKNHPFHQSIEAGLPQEDGTSKAIGKKVKAGDVIGYMGMSGYSSKVNVNNIQAPHLHFGMQLIFNESQKDGDHQIWIDVYQIIKLLQKSKSQVEKDEITKDYNRKNEVNCIVNEPGNDGIAVPMIMYHSILKDASVQGKYVISPKTLEADMKYLKEKGYEAITVSDLIAYVHADAPLPEKPVVLTFDDGYYNNLTYVFALLKQYQMKAVISVVGDYTKRYSEISDPNPNYGHLNYADIKALAESGYVEIGNHSYHMHELGSRQGAGRKQGEQTETYQKILRKDLGKLQSELQEKSGISPVTFTYPYGLISEESLDVVKAAGFQASLSCYENTNYITKDPNCLYLLNRYNREANISTEAFMKKVLKI